MKVGKYPIPLNKTFRFQPTENLKIDIYYGHGFGQDIVTSYFLSRDLDYGFIEFVASC